MSGAPPPSSTCQECGEQKTIGTEEITYSSTRKDSETKGRQGTADLDSLVGEHNQQDTQTRGKSTERRSERNFPICPTPGCPQRKEDRWDLKRWELQNDPNRKYTPETRAQAMQKIEEDERRYENEVAAFRSGDLRAKKGGTMKHEKIKHQEQGTQRHQSDQTRQSVESSRQTTHNSTEQPTSQSYSTDSQSRRTGDQSSPTASTEGDNTNETDTKRWGNPRGSDTTDQESSTATAQGSTDQNDKQPWGHARDTDTTDRTETTTTTTETKTTRTTERSTASGSTNDAQTEKEQFMNGRSRNPKNSPYGQMGTRSADAETGTARATKHDTEEEEEGQDDSHTSRRRK